MSKAGSVISWILCVFFFLFAGFTVGKGMSIPGMFLLGIALVLYPPMRKRIGQITGKSMPAWLRIVLCVVLFIVYFVSLFIATATMPSIYRKPVYRDRLMKIYDEKLANEWPGEYESVYIPTEYGKVHVIAGGPEEAPPVMLLHAASMSAVSWLHNADSLNRHFRTYAVDMIGEAGRSELADAKHYPINGNELAELYSLIADSLGVPKAHWVGASYGGFISVNMAIHAPDRVNKVALLGPMGVTPVTGSTVIKIILATMLPIKPFQQATMDWAIGTDPYTLEHWEPWFWQILDGVSPKEAQPVTFKAGDLEKIKAPVMLVLGSRDELTGDPEKVKELARHVAGIRIDVVDSGHLIGVEKREFVNTEVVGFLKY